MEVTFGGVLSSLPPPGGCWFAHPERYKHTGNKPKMANFLNKKNIFLFSNIPNIAKIP